MYTTDVYKMYTKCTPYFDNFCMHFVYKMYIKVCRNVVYILYTNILYTFCTQKFVKIWDTFVYKHFAYILYTNVYKMYTKICRNVGYILYTNS